MKNKKRPSVNDTLIYEIAKELGLSSKIDKNGWGTLTAAETGKIGGIISARKRKHKQASKGSIDENKLT